MLKGLHLVWALLAVSLCSPVAAQQLPPDWVWCVNEGNAFSPDVQITGCTAVLQRGRETTWMTANAYNHRGSAYRAKGDYDHAITDYGEAIRLIRLRPLLS